MLGVTTKAIRSVRYEMKENSLLLWLSLCATAVLLASCAGTSAQQSQDSNAIGDVVEISDPFESSNRRVFAFNNAVDDAVIHPVVKGYRAAVPKPARTGFSNFLRNLKSPVTFANQLLQGDVDGAGDVVVRTAVNTLIGVGGIFDIAGREGIEYEQEDFGQTLGVWGVGHGPYLVVPVLGPSSLRDYAGYAVDSLADPLRWYLFNTDQEWLYYTKVGADYLVLRESLLDVLADLEHSSIDYYAAVRSTYYQRREAMVRDENSAVAIPDYDDF